MASIDSAARGVKGEVTRWLSEDLVNSACEAEGHRWRARVLTPVVLLRLFVMQVLMGNVACRAVRHFSPLRFTTQAYHKARLRLPLAVIRRVASALIGRARREVTNFGRWKGLHRVLHVDGTGLSMPDTKALQAAYGQPGGQKRGCGFPVMHVLWLFDAATGLAIDLIASRWNTHDMAHVSKLHGMLEKGDVLVGDVAFASFAHLALLLKHQLHGLFRAHQRLIINFMRGRKAKSQLPKGKRKGAPSSRWIKKLGVEDQIVEYIKPTSKPTWMSKAAYAALPATILVRELRYRITQRGYRTKRVTLVTTLIDGERYTKAELAELYQMRWQVEECQSYCPHCYRVYRVPSLGLGWVNVAA